MHLDKSFNFRMSSDERQMLSRIASSMHRCQSAFLRLAIQEIAKELQVGSLKDQQHKKEYQDISSE